MKPAGWLFIAFISATFFNADAAQKQAAICGAKTETHVSGARTETRISGAATPQGNGDGGMQTNGPATPADGKTASGKKAAVKNTPGEVRKPRQPQQATVKNPRSPSPPREPDLPGGK